MRVPEAANPQVPLWTRSSAAENHISMRDGVQPGAIRITLSSVYPGHLDRPDDPEAWFFFGWAERRPDDPDQN